MSRNKAIPLILSIMALNLIFVSNYKITLVDIENANMSLVEQNKGIPNRKVEFTTTKIGNNDIKRVWVTHYCSCVKCTGYEHNPNNVYGAMGVTLTPMVSVASNDYELGTRLKVTHSNGEQEIWIVQDRGVSGHLDLYVGNSHELALSIPNEYVTVEII